MMNRIIPLIILLVVGCAPQQSEYIYSISATLDTNPQGATIICDGQDAGYAPILYSRRNNIDYIGENRPITDEEATKEIEASKIRRGELKLGENKALTDEETVNELKWLEAEKIMNGELMVGENKFFSDEEARGFVEATKIVEGKLKLDEYTVSIDAEEMQELIQSVKDIKEYRDSKCTAYWSSGVSKEYPVEIPFTYAGNGRFIYTLQRPEGEGYAQDAEFALKVKQLKQDKQTADHNAWIALRAAQAQERAARAAQSAATTQAIQSNKVTTCSTTLGITTCY